MNFRVSISASLFMALAISSLGPAAAQVQSLQERLEALQESKTSDIRTPFLHAARRCIEMIENGEPFEPGILRARYSETVDLDKPYSRQRWTGANGLFGVRVGAMPGRGEDVVRSCALREGAGISDEQIEGIQSDLVELMKEIVLTGAYEKIEWPKDGDTGGRRTYSVVANPLNARGCNYSVKLDVTSRWADFSVFEDAELECAPELAGEPRE